VAAGSREQSKSKQKTPAQILDRCFSITYFLTKGQPTQVFIGEVRK